jgi:hypothetical protein
VKCAIPNRLRYLLKYFVVECPFKKEDYYFNDKLYTRIILVIHKLKNQYIYSIYVIVADIVYDYCMISDMIIVLIHY